MNPIIEEWFIELDEGDEQLRDFIRQVSDAVISDMKLTPGLIELLRERNLAVVPTSRLWWENPRGSLFRPVRTMNPGRVIEAPEVEETEPDGSEAFDIDRLPNARGPVAGAFLEGALEGIAVGQRVYYWTKPGAQQDMGGGVVQGITGTGVTVRSDNGRVYVIDLTQGGRIELMHRQ